MKDHFLKLEFHLEDLAYISFHAGPNLYSKIYSLEFLPNINKYTDIRVLMNRILLYTIIFPYTEVWKVSSCIYPSCLY